MAVVVSMEVARLTTYWRSGSFEITNFGLILNSYVALIMSWSLGSLYSNLLYFATKRISGLIRCLYT
jgi:hypothetical protein